MRRFHGTRLLGLAGASALALLAASGASAQDAGTLVLGEGLDAALEEGDTINDLGAPYDSYTVTLSAGQRFEVEMRSDDFDAYLELYGTYSLDDFRCCLCSDAVYSVSNLVIYSAWII